MRRSEYKIPISSSNSHFVFLWRQKIKLVYEPDPLSKKFELIGMYLSKILAINTFMLSEVNISFGKML